LVRNWRFYFSSCIWRFYRPHCYKNLFNGAGGEKMKISRSQLIRGAGVIDLYDEIYKMASQEKKKSKKADIMKILDLFEKKWEDIWMIEDEDRDYYLMKATRKN
jgi:hypothetical protein